MYGGPAKNPKTITCHCGEKVTLSDVMTNVCSECGQYYNGSGQRLVPPSEWEEPWDE